MYFESLQAALYMDGHGVFVWSAYAITFLVIGALLFLPARRRRRKLQQMRAELRRQAATPQPQEVP